MWGTMPAGRCMRTPTDRNKTRHKHTNTQQTHAYSPSKNPVDANKQYGSNLNLWRVNTDNFQGIYGFSEFLSLPPSDHHQRAIGIRATMFRPRTPARHRTAQTGAISFLSILL